MVRTIESGRVREVIKYKIHPNTQLRAGRKKGNTLPRKQDANERACVKRLARLINCNFAHGDLLISPNYTDEALLAITGGEENVDAVYKKHQKELEKFLRRLKYALGRAGVDLRYIAVTSDMDGETGELTRPHHHILIPAEGIQMRERELYVGDRPLRDIWGHGSMDYRPLRDQEDYTPIAEYLMRQVRRQPDGRKYKPSRNLKKPRLISEKIVYTAAELRLPKGATLLHRAEHKPGETQYIRYTKPKKAPGRRKRTTEEEEE